jgi:predicted transcriptional regulator
MSKYIGNNQFSNLSIEERFWQKVNIKSPDECWEWIAGKHPQGYGTFGMGSGKSVYAHRMAYFLHYGINPKSNHVCHHCDNPSCVNPSHLFLGTHRDNMQDMVAKNRNVAHSGEDNGNSKLTNAQTKEIKRLYKSGDFTQGQIAKRFGITQARVSMITKTNTSKAKRLTDSEKTALTEMANSGQYTQVELGEVFGISQAAVSYHVCHDNNP